jgi:hypothetical protein
MTRGCAIALGFLLLTSVMRSSCAGDLDYKKTAELSWARGVATEFLDAAMSGKWRVGYFHLKYQASEDWATTPNESDIGRKFSFQVPESFLKGESNIMDNSNVQHLCKVDP